MKFTYHKKFKNKLSHYKHNDPETYKQALIAISRFKSNPQDTRINLHPLKRKLKGKFAFSVTGDIRIVFELTSKNTARFLAIGTHPEVY